MAQALLEELELSLPFRESAIDHVEHCLPDSTIEDILGVSAAKSDPGCVLKVRLPDTCCISTQKFTPVYSRVFMVGRGYYFFSFGE